MPAYEGPRIIKLYDRTVEELRVGVNCATVLKKATPPWLLDRTESSERASRSLSSRMAGQAGANRTATPRATSSDSYLEPSLNFGEAEDAAALGQVQPDFTPAEPARQARHSSPGRSEMGPAPAAETLPRTPPYIGRSPDQFWPVSSTICSCKIPLNAASFGHSARPLGCRRIPSNCQLRGNIFLKGELAARRLSLRCRPRPTATSTSNRSAIGCWGAGSIYYARHPEIVGAISPSG
jgi:hypothetical protein